MREKGITLIFILLGITILVIICGTIYYATIWDKNLIFRESVKIDQAQITPKPQLTQKPTAIPTSILPEIKKVVLDNGWINYQNSFFNYSISLPHEWHIYVLPATSLTRDAEKGPFIGETDFTNDNTKTTIRLISNFQGSWRYEKQEKLTIKSGETIIKAYEGQVIHFNIFSSDGDKNLYIRVTNSKPTDQIDNIIKTLEFGEKPI